ncbi:MAG: hypothetical protein KDC09_13635 [Bacteroidales bacterium]|nr:hypothetical protein [Bacteroidales bacterium]
MNEKNKTYNSEENEMEIPEVLKNVNKSSLFPVPEKYFDGLPSKIQERVFAKDQKSVRMRTFPGLVQKRILIPVVSMFFIVALFFIFNRDKGFNDEYQFTGINLEETMDQYPEFFEDMDEYTMIEVLITSSDNMDDPASAIWSDSSITNQEILDYFDEENIDVEYLYNL